jgi:hypothetical protein
LSDEGSKLSAAPPPPQPVRTEAHSSYLAYIMFEFRAIARILPNLKQKQKHAWLAPLALCLLVLLAAIGAGIYTDGYGIHPPEYLHGICPPPASIKNGGCYQSVAVTITTNGQISTTTSQVSTGTIILPNSTAAKK